MSTRLPAFVDPVRLAETRQVLAGELVLGGMARLPVMSGPEDKSVQAEFRFGIDEQGQKIVHAHVRARLPIKCQRCLQSMELNIDTKVTLGIVTSDKEAGGLAGMYEPLLVETQTIALTDIIEDELILALPNVAMHSPEECPAWQEHQSDETTEEIETAVERERPNPFAELANLKQTGKS